MQREDDTKRHREEMTIYKPRKEACLLTGLTQKELSLDNTLIC